MLIRSCCDEGKRCVETLFFDYHRQHKLDNKVIGIFNTYGPRMHPNDGQVVRNFIVQTLSGQMITIYGNDSQARSFCHVDDLIEGMLKLTASHADFIWPVNIGTPGDFSMLELAESVLKLSRSKFKLKLLPLGQDDPKQGRPDTTLAQNMLYWAPHVALQAGLQKTIDYFKTVIPNH